MKIKKGYLNLFLSVLGATTPKFADARVRDRIIRELSDEFKTYEEDRIKMCKSLCKKDDKDAPIMLKSKNEKGEEVSNFQFTDENFEKFSEEIIILHNEDVSLDINDKEKAILNNLVENSQYTPKMGEAEIVDEILKENTKPTKNKK